MWGSDADRREFGQIYLLWYGDPGVRDRKAAVKRLTILADEGYAPAQFALAMAYFDGEGVRRDYATAFAHAKSAAEQGYPGAENMVGGLYAAMTPKHDACPHNPVEAARWYRRAAERGLSSAMFNLATCCRTGLGVERDTLEAFVWASLAVQCSSIRSRPAEVLRDQVAAELTEELRRQGDDRVAALKVNLRHPWSEPMLYWRSLAGP